MGKGFLFIELLLWTSYIRSLIPRMTVLDNYHLYLIEEETELKDDIHLSGPKALVLSRTFSLPSPRVRGLSIGRSRF